MAKDLPWFKFEISEYLFGRIQKQPLDVQGTFINLCCRYWHKMGELSYDDAKIDFTADHIDKLRDGRVIKNDGGYVVINFLDEQLNERVEVSRVNSAKGKLSASLRAKRRASKSTAVESGQQQLNPVEPLLTAVEVRSTDLQPIPTEERRGEDNIYTYGSGKFSIAIRKTYANEQAKRIFDLKLFFGSENRLDDLSQKGWIHYDAFVEASAGRVFNDSDHVYNSYRSFCLEYKPPETPKKYEEAELNKTLWVQPEWEKYYGWRLKSEPDFRKHFGYGELQGGTSVGINDNGRGLTQGNEGPQS